MTAWLVRGNWTVDLHVQNVEAWKKKTDIFRRQFVSFLIEWIFPFTPNFYFMLFIKVSLTIIQYWSRQWLGDWMWEVIHDDVIKWKHFPRNWSFVRGIHRSPVNSPHKGGQWCGALRFSLICVWINGWVNNREAGDLRRYRAHYDVIVMKIIWTIIGVGA